MNALYRRYRQAVKFLQLMWNANGRRGLRHGVGMTIEHAPAFQNRSFKTIIDIGANKGQFSLFSHNQFPAASIHAFEPLPGPAGIFRRVFAGVSNVTLHEAAIGPEASNALMHVSQRDDSSSLLPITIMQDRLFPGTAEKNTLTVQVAPLDTFIDAAAIAMPALLKIDVQGFELDALKGCEGLLNHFDAVYVECSFIELYEGQALAGEVRDFLTQRGFTETGVFNEIDHPEHGPIQADLFFTHEAQGDGT